MNDLTKRALHTFYQAFIPVFLAGLINVFNAFQNNLGIGKSALVALVVSSAAAGISALKSAYLANK